MDHREAFGIALRERRKALLLSQDELGHRAGVDRTHVSVLELGQKGASLDVIVKLAAALETKASDLLQRMEELTVSDDGSGNDNTDLTSRP